MSTSVPAMCPACSSKNTKRTIPLSLRTSDGELKIHVHRCSDCSHRFLQTTELEQRAIENVYDHAYAGFRHDEIFNRCIREEIRDVLAPRVPPPSRILDVGCGNGEFLAAAKEFGYQVEGVDIAKEAAKLCERRDVVAYCGDFLTFPFEGKYDLITMWDVLEHLRRPADFISRASSLLSSDGIIVLKVPGFGAANFPLIRLYNHLAQITLGAPGHLQYFNEQSLEALLTRCLLRRVEWLESKGMRGKPQTSSLKKRLGRTVASVINRVSKNHNLYVVASHSAASSLR